MGAGASTTRGGAPLDILDPASVSRWLGRVLPAAAALVVLWLLVTGVSGTARASAAGFAVLTLLSSVVVRRVAPRHVRLVVQATLVGGACILTAGAITAGPEESPFLLFFVWLAPFAFLVWRPLVAAAFAAAISLVVTMLIGWHPGHTSPDLHDVPAWLIALGGPLVMGWVVGRLTARILQRQADAERTARWRGTVIDLARQAISETEVAGSVAGAAARALRESLGAAWVEVAVTAGDQPVVATEGEPLGPSAAKASRIPIGDPATPAGEITVVRGGPLDPEEAQLVRGVADVLAVAARRACREHQERNRAGRDALTGLPGRELFAHLLGRELERRPDAGGTLLLIDIDGFGLVNDTLGPVAGDQLLAGIAGRFRAALGADVTLGRIGGDKFAAFDPVAERGAPAVDLAKRVQRALREPFDLAGVGQHVTASIGVLVVPPGALDAHEAMRDAHVAQRRAAGRGRGRLELFDPGMRQGLEQRRELEHDLREALRNQEFRLVYQPIVELGTGRVVGAEALLRWERPGIGVIGPTDFMAVAEESDLIVPIGKWVLREALRQLRAWQDTVPSLGDFRMSVNLSGRQLADPGFGATVTKFVRGYDVDPARLTFELTETALVGEGPEVEHAVHELKRLGAGVALDDFGTGYASLQYVRRFPFDTLKLDRSFVLDRAPGNTALITAAIAMGDALGMRVLAEGIESDEHAAELEGLGCRLGQGYHFGRPVPAAGLRTMLRRRDRLSA